MTRYVEAHSDNKSVLFVLQNLGYLPNDFDDNWITPLLSNKNQKIRLWSAKTLGKTKKEKNIQALKRTALQDESTEVRREAVSSIGRLKTETIIPVLLEFLRDDDPKIVLQAIRGLLTFKQDANVRERLEALRNHPNEVVQKVIGKEYFAQPSEDARKQAHKNSADFLKRGLYT